MTSVQAENKDGDLTMNREKVLLCTNLIVIID
jgi:hypothetical protein